MRRFKLIRDVSKKECPWLEKDYKKDDVVFYYSGYTYGCISYMGVPCSDKLDEGPFFEMPENSLEEI